MTRVWLRSVLAALTSLVLLRPLAAQTAVIGGTVMRDSSGKGLGDVDVAIPALKRGARSNFAGEFRIDRLAAGTYVVVFRHLGFNVRTDTIALKDGEVVDNEFVMAEAPATLGAQQVTGEKEHQPIYLEEFNARMKAGFGHFMTDSMLRKDADSHNFANYIKGKVPGVHLVDNGPLQFLATGRKSCTGPAFQCGGATPCYMSVYIDGVAEYVNSTSVAGPPNFAELKSEDFAAVEFYASGATAPARYNMTGSDCGVLLLWRRYRGP